MAVFAEGGDGSVFAAVADGEMRDRAIGEPVESAAFAANPPCTRAVLEDDECSPVREAVRDREHVGAALADLH